MQMTSCPLPKSHQSGGGGMVAWIFFVADHILLRNLTDPSRGGKPSHPLFPTWKSPFLTLSRPSWGAEVTPAAMLSPTWHWESFMSHTGTQSLCVSQGLRAAGSVAGVNTPPGCTPSSYMLPSTHILSFVLRSGSTEVPRFGGGLTGGNLQHSLLILHHHPPFQRMSLPASRENEWR